MRMSLKPTKEYSVSMKRKIFEISSRLRATLLAGAMAVAVGSLAFTHLAEAKDQSRPAVHLTVDQQPLKRDGQFTTSFAPVVKKVAPSVVKVFTTSKAVQLSQAHPRMFNDPFFRRFFGDEFGPGDDAPDMPMPKQHGLGSGVIITQDGYILTNNHVVDNAEEIKVAMSDQREFTAKVIGTDPKTDVAVLKIPATGLPYATLGDSSQIEVGDVVLAVGNPFGIGQTVTMGIVSAKGRGNIGIEDYEDFIQTDAAINPGNSGGALVDAEGRLVGINTAILSRSGGNHGIGFAVPINLARGVMDSLIEHGRVVRGFMGVTIQDVTPSLAKEFNLSKSAGALVSDVTSGSPADKAGLKSGDIITELNGKPIVDSRQLKLAVAQTAPGSKAAVKVLRDGKEKEFEVMLKELPGTQKLARGDSDQTTDTEHLKGVAVTDIDADAQRQFKLPKDVKGALVASVEPNSAAYEAGLREGDVILEINRHRVNNAQEAVEQSDKATSGTILLRVWSRGGSHFIAVDESKSK